MRGKSLWLLLVLPSLVGFDFWSKTWVRDHLEVGQQIELIPGALSLLHAENTGIAGSIPVPLSLIFGFGLVALAVLAWTFWRLPADDRLHAAAIGAIAAGALGNLLDRVPDGTVTDMVRMYTEHPGLSRWLIQTFGTATWPIYNVADVALLGGVGAWVVGDALHRDADPPDDDDAPEAAAG